MGSPSRKAAIVQTHTFRSMALGLQEGRKFTRQSWHDDKIYLQKVDEKVMIMGNDEDGKFHPMTFGVVDLTADDWLEVK